MQRYSISNDTISSCDPTCFAIPVCTSRGECMMGPNCFNLVIGVNNS